MSSTSLSKAPSPSPVPTQPRWAWLPPIGSRGYYILLGCIALFILGPLGGVTAAYMNFSLGFFVGGQVLAGILGSAVTYGYGAEGKHGANYMQTMAASVAGMSGMCVLVQAMTWLGLPEPPTWQLMLFFLCIGMFGVGVGMLYTPLLVDRMQLTYPSGFAVANILRALTDVRLLKRSIGQLGGGAAAGLGGGLIADKIASIAATGISFANIGAGMVVGARIAVPGFVVGCIGLWVTPYLVSIGWLGEKDHFRKIGFIIALGAIMGAAIVDLTLIGFQAVQSFKNRSQAPAVVEEDWKKTNTKRLILWVAFWAIALVTVATQVLHQPPLFVGLAVALVFIFVLINGISTGISDSNPISSAFVVTVFIMGAFGLAGMGVAAAGVGLMCGSIMLISTSTGVDMQQDRSTGWRLGTNRTIQFRFQVIGIIMGAIMTVMFARAFMSTFPVLKIDLFANPDVAGAEKWSSAMTFKFVGAIRGITDQKPHVMQALYLGILIGLVTELLRKLIKRAKAYQRFRDGSKVGFATDFCLDALFLPSPYASSFGGFVEFLTTTWYAAGGAVSSALNTLSESAKKSRPKRPEDDDIPEDMSTTSLVGGGLIAGESLAYLGIGIAGLLATLAGG